MRVNVLLLLLSLTVSGCVVTVPNLKRFTALGPLSDGMSWSETQSAVSGDITLEQVQEFLEAQPDRTCVPLCTKTDLKTGVCTQYLSVCTDAAPSPGHPAVKLPRRAGAICYTYDDDEKRKNSEEVACRMLGNRCRREVKAGVAK